jgi:hypothetical protein
LNQGDEPSFKNNNNNTTKENLTLKNYVLSITPFLISNAQMYHHLSLKMPPKVGISNEKWCKT